MMDGHGLIDRYTLNPLAGSHSLGHLDHFAAYMVCVMTTKVNPK